MSGPMSPAEIYRGFIEHDVMSALVSLGRTMAPPSRALVRESERTLTETSALAASMGMEDNTHTPANVIRRVALITALVAATHRRKRWFCPHAFDVTSKRMTHAMLTTGIATCKRCAKRAPMFPFEDDGRCDICDQPASEFREFVYQDILGQYSGNQCEECYQFAEVMRKEQIDGPQVPA